MEYLDSINDPLRRTDESNIKYENMFERFDLIYGTMNIAGDKVDFSKSNLEYKKSMEPCLNWEKDLYIKGYKSSSGCRLRFTTSSPKIILKAQLRREWDYINVVLCNSSGFDVYEVNGNNYSHKTVFAPQSGKKIFAEPIYGKGERNYCIFLPTYNVIEELYVGTEANHGLYPYPYDCTPPIVFYGNSVTQGAAATRSGYITANIVSRELDNDIINFSINASCKGQLCAADEIGKLNVRAIIVDYTRNANSFDEFKKSYLPFYQRLRKWHPDKPVILLSTSNFCKQQKYRAYDNLVEEVCQNAQANNENTFYIDTSKLVDEDEYLVTAPYDGIHLSDYGMWILANKICEILK